MAKKNWFAIIQFFLFHLKLVSLLAFQIGQTPCNSLLFSNFYIFKEETYQSNPDLWKIQVNKQHMSSVIVPKSVGPGISGRHVSLKQQNTICIAINLDCKDAKQSLTAAISSTRGGCMQACLLALVLHRHVLQRGNVPRQWSRISQCWPSLYFSRPRGSPRFGKRCVTWLDSQGLLLWLSNPSFFCKGQHLIPGLHVVSIVLGLG